MIAPTNKYNNYLIQSIIISSFVVLGLFLWEGAIEFDLYDEGYFWYGAQRIILGDVPMIDFQSYDPGRYYWSAMIMSLMNDKGIMAARVAAALFQLLGLFVGLLIIARSLKKRNIIYLVVSAITLVLWMLPYYKSFDFTASILLVGALTFLVEKPTNARYFLAGVCIGLVAYFGRNHGVYGVIGCIGVLLWLNIRETEGIGLINGVLILSVGILVGYSPMILMILFIPDFANTFVEGINLIFQVKATNLPLPVPWPWLVKFDSGWLYQDIRRVLLGVFFIGIVAFGVLSICWISWQKLRNKQASPALVASSFLALPYAHYSYSRADLTHLSLGVFPLLIGSLAVLASQSFKLKWPLAGILFISSLWIMREVHPGWHCRTTKCVEQEVSGSILLMEPQAANRISLLDKLVNNYAKNGQSFVATPFWPGAYALFERKSPMHEIYILFPRSPAFERAEIERIKAAKPGFVIIENRALDGREELRFRNNRPLIFNFIETNFDLVYELSDSSYQIYKSKAD